MTPPAGACTGGICITGTWWRLSFQRYRFGALGCLDHRTGQVKTQIYIYISIYIYVCVYIYIQKINNAKYVSYIHKISTMFMIPKESSQWLYCNAFNFSSRLTPSHGHATPDQFVGATSGDRWELQMICKNILDMPKRIYTDRITLLGIWDQEQIIIYTNCD